MDPNVNQPQVRSVDVELLKDLELVSSKVFPLPGATFNRNNHTDSRVHLQNAATGIPITDKITLYEHIATVRHTKTDTFFVAFRQTMDCLLLEQQDLTKFPEWLMKSANKKTELSVHIYQVKVIGGLPVFPSKLSHMNSHEDWLKQIDDNKTFETVAHFLLKNNAISIDMFEKM
jgi:hypothetical protein